MTEDKKRANDSKYGSIDLFEAVMDLFARTANREHISLEEAMRRHLKPIERQVIPGTEQVHKTCSAQRIAVNG